MSHNLVGKWPCTRCGHDQYEHNPIVGCQHCRCAANTSEAGNDTHYPGTERPYRGDRILPPGQYLHEWQRPQPEAPPVRRSMVEIDDLVGAKDIAEMLGVGKPAVSNWVARHASFPQPLTVVSGSIPIYSRAAVLAWARAAGKVEA